jgi:hypothetical protein
MHIVRFIFPFLFARNWYTGAWEFSWQRFTLFALTVGFIILGVIIAVILQTPVTYTAEI